MPKRAFASFEGLAADSVSVSCGLRVAAKFNPPNKATKAELRNFLRFKLNEPVILNAIL
jgi:hypothetical protein